MTFVVLNSSGYPTRNYASKLIECLPCFDVSVPARDSFKLWVLKKKKLHCLLEVLLWQKLNFIVVLKSLNQNMYPLLLGRSSRVLHSFVLGFWLLKTSLEAIVVLLFVSGLTHRNVQTVYLLAVRGNMKETERFGFMFFGRLSEETLSCSHLF